MISFVAKQKPRQQAPAAAPSDAVTQLNMRLPVELLEAMDGLVEEINQRRPWPKMTRSDLIRIVVGKAIEDRPDWLLGTMAKVGARVSAEEAYPGLGALMQDEGKKASK